LDKLKREEETPTKAVQPKPVTRAQNSAAQNINIDLKNRKKKKEKGIKEGENLFCCTPPDAGDFMQQPSMDYQPNNVHVNLTFNFN